MSWRATAYIKRLSTAPSGDKLTKSEKFLALMIAERYNDDEGMAWPTVETLADDVMLSRRRTQELQRSLEKKGLIIICKRRRLNGGSTSNGIRFPELEKEGEGGCEQPQGGDANNRMGGVRTAASPCMKNYMNPYPNTHTNTAKNV